MGSYTAGATLGLHLAHVIASGAIGNVPGVILSSAGAYTSYRTLKNIKKKI